MPEPTRVVQLSRRKGSKREPGVVVVDRSSPWGNPFHAQQGRTRADAVAMYEDWIFSRSPFGGFDPVWVRDHVHELAGHTLGCWCPQDGPCHAQVLARMADAESVARDLAAASACSIEEARRVVASTLEAFADG